MDRHLNDLVFDEDKVTKLLGGCTKSIVDVVQCKGSQHMFPRLMRCRNGGEQ